MKLVARMLNRKREAEIIALSMFWKKKLARRSLKPDLTQFF